MTFIVKVQKPLASTEKNPGYLVYGHIPRFPKYRTRFIYNLPANVLTVLQKVPKAYFHAVWNVTLNNWVLGDQAPSQDW